jgi:hypothetical protein
MLRGKFRNDIPDLSLERHLFKNFRFKKFLSLKTCPEFRRNIKTQVFVVITLFKEQVRKTRIYHFSWDHNKHNDNFRRKHLNNCVVYLYSSKITLIRKNDLSI